MVELGMKDLEKTNILNNRLFQICVFSHFDTERIQRLPIGSIGSQKDEMRSNFQLKREMTNWSTSFVAVNDEPAPASADLHDLWAKWPGTQA